MARIIQHGAQVWCNYHRTFSCDVLDRIEIANGDEASGRALLKSAATVVRELLARAKSEGKVVRPIGAGWSPSAINQCKGGWLVETLRLNRCFRIADEHVHGSSDVKGEALLLVQAGATVDEVYESAEEMGRSLTTGGASNGQSMAGCCATGSHGSVLTAGGIQDQVRAMQLVTPERIVWVEPSTPVLSDDFIAATGSDVVRDDEIFEACLVHVGAMGFVTAMLLETEPLYMVRNIQKAVRIERAAIEWLSNGDFARFSRHYALDEDPYFTQVIFNPFDPFDKKAGLRLLYKRPFDPAIPPPGPAEMGAGYDALTILGKAMASTDLFRAEVLQLAMENAYPKNRDIDDPPAVATWGNTTEEHSPIANLFNGSVNIERHLLDDVFDRIVHEFTEGGGGTVVTLRFVEKSRGLLSPHRWEHNCVIDFDGPNLESSHEGYKKVVEMLDREGIPFTRHWGKTNNLDAARVVNDYGDNLTRFIAAQEALMPDPVDREVFVNEELRKIGLI